MSRRYRSMWMSQHYPLAYRVLPKCGCSTVGQWFHWLDKGEFYPGLIHDPTAPILKWGYEHARPIIADRIDAGGEFIFTLARNPYRRVLSSFADKIHGFQSNGTRYRGGQIHSFLENYGVDFGPRGNIFKNFRGFIYFVSDTILKGEPIEPDPHWRPCADALTISLQLSQKWSIDFIGHLENIQNDLRRIARQVELDVSMVPTALPRENSTSLGRVPFQSFFGEEEIKIITKCYKEDFEWFNYSFDPGQLKPMGEVDLMRVLTEGRSRALERNAPIVEVADQINTS